MYHVHNHLLFLVNHAHLTSSPDQVRWVITSLHAHSLHHIWTNLCTSCFILIQSPGFLRWYLYHSPGSSPSVSSVCMKAPSSAIRAVLAHLFLSYHFYLSLAHLESGQLFCIPSFHSFPVSYVSSVWHFIIYNSLLNSYKLLSTGDP